MKKVVIASAVRTPIGSYGGAYKNVSAIDLGKTVVVGALEKAGIKPDQVEELIFGSVLQGGLGQNVARQVSMAAGIPIETPSFTINKVCGSGLKSVALAAQAIKAGDIDIAVVGGTENMSQAGYIAPNNRWGKRMGNDTLVDQMINDGLWDAFNNYHMGVTAENVAEQFNVTRQEQDEFAAWSQNKAEAAVEAGKFKDEIVPVEVPQRKGDPVIVDTDEYYRKGVTAESLSGLRPAFVKDGTVTAANASGLNDGAAALVVMSEDKAKELGIKPLATVVSYGSGGVDPSIMGMGPVPATRLALEKADLTIEDIDLVEANEAFASQAIAIGRELGIDNDKLNVNGGAIALGHPIGASGARILVTLLHEMNKRDDKLGLATLCIGGGMGTSVIVERE